MTLRPLLVCAVLWSSPALANCEDALRTELLSIQALTSAAEAELASLQEAEEARLARIERAASQPVLPPRPPRETPEPVSNDGETQ